MSEIDKSIRIPKKKFTIGAFVTLGVLGLWEMAVKPFITKKVTDLMESQESQAGDFAQQQLLDFFSFMQGVPLWWVLLGAALGLWASKYFEPEIQQERVDKIYSDETVANIRSARKIFADMSSQAEAVIGTLDYTGRNCSLCGNAAKLQTIGSSLPSDEMRQICASMQKHHRKMHSLQKKMINLKIPTGLAGVKVKDGKALPIDQQDIKKGVSIKVRELLISSRENWLFKDIVKKQKRFWTITSDFAE